MDVATSPNSCSARDCEDAIEQWPTPIMSAWQRDEALDVG
jgi:hypothetical protein